MYMYVLHISNCVRYSFFVSMTFFSTKSRFSKLQSAHNIFKVLYIYIYIYIYMYIYIYIYIYMNEKPTSVCMRYTITVKQKTQRLS